MHIWSNLRLPEILVHKMINEIAINLNLGHTVVYVGNRVFLRSDGLATFSIDFVDQ